VYGFYFASCMNIIFNELRQQRVNEQNKKYMPFLFLLLIYPRF